MTGARRPPFAPVDHVAVAVAHDLGADVRRVRRRDGRFGHREPGADLAGQQRFQPALLVRVAAVAREDFHVPGVGRGAVEHLGRDLRAAHELAQRSVLAIGQPGAPFGFRQEQVPEPLRARFGLELLHDRRLRPGRRTGAQLSLVGALVGGDLRLDERANALLERRGGRHRCHAGPLSHGRSENRLAPEQRGSQRGAAIPATVRLRSEAPWGGRVDTGKLVGMPGTDHAE
jgi:hypothetical protein